MAAVLTEVHPRIQTRMVQVQVPRVDPNHPRLSSLQVLQSHSRWDQVPQRRPLPRARIRSVEDKSSSYHRTVHSVEDRLVELIEYVVVMLFPWSN